MKGSEDLTQGITCLKRHSMVNLVISTLDIMGAGSRRFSSLGYYRIKKWINKQPFWLSKVNILVRNLLALSCAMRALALIKNKLFLTQRIHFPHGASLLSVDSKMNCYNILEHMNAIFSTP